MLQLRSRTKHHFQHLWKPVLQPSERGEDLEKAAQRRLRQEFGFDAELKEVFSSVYKATDPVSGLTEHEFDHVFVGTYDGPLKPNTEEIDDWKWVSPSEQDGILRGIQVDTRLG